MNTAFKEFLNVLNNHYNDGLPRVILEFNMEDYDNFKKNANELKEIFKAPFDIERSDQNLIGGFKAYLTDGSLTYDYTINELIKKKATFIEREFSKTISDLEIKKIEQGFENFIKKKRKEIEESLKDYDQT